MKHVVLELERLEQRVAPGLSIGIPPVEIGWGGNGCNSCDNSRASASKGASKGGSKGHGSDDSGSKGSASSGSKGHGSK